MNEARDATADSTGAWKVTLPALAAGGPFDLVVSGKRTITLHDVLVGEVWVLSGSFLASGPSLSASRRLQKSCIVYHT